MQSEQKLGQGGEVPTEGMKLKGVMAGAEPWQGLGHGRGWAVAGAGPWQGRGHGGRGHDMGGAITGGGGRTFVCQNVILERENTGESAAAGKPSLQPRVANVQAKTEGTYEKSCT